MMRIAAAKRRCAATCQAGSESGGCAEEADRSPAAGADVLAARGTDEHGLCSAALHRLLQPAKLCRRSTRLELYTVRSTRQTDRHPHWQAEEACKNNKLDDSQTGPH